MTGLYRLRVADRSVKLGAVLFLLMLGYAYVFAFLMVRNWAGLTPSAVSATYAPGRRINAAQLPATSRITTRPIRLSGLMEERHRVGTDPLSKPPN